MTIAKGSILHVEGFRGLNGPCNKFVFVLGHTAQSSILVFTISSQQKWTATRLGREMVRIPVGTCQYLPMDSWIQCFHHAHELQLAAYKMSFRSTLPAEFFASVRTVVTNSFVLKRMEIADCIDVMDNDKSVII